MNAMQTCQTSVKVGAHEARIVLAHSRNLPQVITTMKSLLTRGNSAG